MTEEKIKNRDESRNDFLDLEERTLDLPQEVKPAN